MRRTSTCALGIALALAGGAAPAAVINPGDLLVVDNNVFTDRSPGVTRLTPTGVGTAVSTFVSPGAALAAPSAVAATAGGPVFAADVNSGLIVRIDPATGAQSVIGT